MRRPTPVPKNAAPAVQNFYRELDLFKTTAMNFGYQLDKLAEVRADYLKTIKFASDEFVELVESGQISFEEGSLRANKLRNVLFEISRRKDYDLGRSLAKYFKPEARPFEWFLERYAQKRFSLSFSSLTSQARKDAVYLDIVIAAGRDNKGISGITPISRQIWKGL